MKQLSFILAVILMCIVFAGCSSQNDNVSAPTESDNLLQTESAKESDYNTATESNSTSSPYTREEIISILTEDGYVWRVEGYMFHAVHFTYNGDQLYFVEYSDGRYYEGTIYISEDGSKLLFNDENNIVNILADGEYYHLIDSNDEMEYNTWRLYDTLFKFGNRGSRWEKVSMYNSFYEDIFE